MARDTKKTEGAAAAPSETEKKKVIPSDVFEADGKKYKFVAYAFILDGEQITAEQALKDEKVLAQLVKIKSGVIAPVEEGGE